LLDTCARTESTYLADPWVVALKSENVHAGAFSAPHLPKSPGDVASIENPYLFPHNLLDVTSGRFAGVVGGAESATAHQGPDDDIPRWWLIHTRPRHEKTLARELRAFGVAHYLPVTKCKALTRGRPRVTRAPQFPGYFFMWGNSDKRLLALKTNRVVATHQVDDQASLASQLWDLADLIAKGVPLRIEERLMVGQYVRVKSGLLRDKRGVIMRRAGKTRLFVLVNELLGGVSLEIEQHLLEPY
jgi:Transcription termination factor nusG